MKIFSSDTQSTEINSIDSWRINCAPKGKDAQWKPKRSAMELARFWTNKDHQKEFLAFIQNVLPNISFDYAIPEFPTKFDDYRSPRQNDLVIFAQNNDKKVLISIEGKADEPYGNKLVKEELEKARQTLETKPSSNKLKRIEELIELFSSLPRLLKCRYQLLTWLAGSIKKAEGYTDTIILISQEFHSDKTTNANIERNSNDLNRFVDLISNGTVQKVKTNEICTPIFFKGINCHFEKHITQL